MTDFVTLLNQAVTESRATRATHHGYGRFTFRGNRIRVKFIISEGKNEYYLNDQYLTRAQIERRFRGVMA